MKRRDFVKNMSVGALAFALTPYIPVEVYTYDFVSEQLDYKQIYNYGMQIYDRHGRRILLYACKITELDMVRMKKDNIATWSDPNLIFISLLKHAKERLPYRTKLVPKHG